MPQGLPILVIGGASVDRLRAAEGAVTTPGGGGLYTAVAARKAGGDVRFFGYRPDPLPELFERAATTVAWHGPPVRLEDIPHFEIVYDTGGDARMETATWGNEATLDPDMVPDFLLSARYIHIAAIHDASLQMKFISALRRRSRARLSAGTFGYMVHRSPDAVRALMDAVDLFFLNAFEAEAIFGPQPPTVRPGQILVVTRGSDGADVWQGDWCTRVPVCPARPVDLTGAGDSVCGGMLAGLAAGMHPVDAARHGTACAAIAIEAPGMTALLDTDRAAVDARKVPLIDRRCAVDDSQVDRIAAVLRDLPDVRPFDFTGPHFPRVGDAHALDYFFAAIKHQFGFWTPGHGSWRAPTYATLGGERLKGSDYCFASFRRQLERDPRVLSPQGQAALRWQDTESLFRDDDGQVPLPVLANHHALARGYGRDLWELGWTPQSLVAEAHAAPDPVRTLLARLDHITGYREDPFRKKATLLVVALGQRPERFIELHDGASLRPIIDYHLMRSCLRTGLVRVQDADLAARLAERKLVPPTDEVAVRKACFDAIERLCARSGRDVGTVDWFFFNARRRCPEVTEPECARCPLDSTCAHRKDLFQPVLRTTFY
ncbi:MAG: carbohydrate kinase family protein [Myxococcales bacterium]|nr:carbohydrate kinase family protein [Myxococcales bacterium]